VKATSAYVFSTHPEDRATLRSDPSAEMSAVRMEAGPQYARPLFFPSILMAVMR